MPALNYPQLNSFLDLSLQYEGRKVVEAARDRNQSRIQHRHDIAYALRALRQMNENLLNCTDQSAISAFQQQQTRCFQLMSEELVAELAQRAGNAQQTYEITNMITIRVEAIEINGDGDRSSSTIDDVDELAQMIGKLCL